MYYWPKGGRTADLAVEKQGYLLCNHIFATTLSSHLSTLHNALASVVSFTTACPPPEESQDLVAVLGWGLGSKRTENLCKTRPTNSRGAVAELLSSTTAARPQAGRVLSCCRCMSQKGDTPRQVARHGLT